MKGIRISRFHGPTLGQTPPLHVFKNTSKKTLSSLEEDAKKKLFELTENGEQHGGSEWRVGDGLVLGLAGPRHAVVGSGRSEPDDGDGGHAAVGGLLAVGEDRGLVLVLAVF